MIYLLLFVLSSMVFVQLLRYGHRSDMDTLSAVAVNYACAFAASILLFALRVSGPFNGPVWPPVLAGAINGMLFFSHVPFVLGSFRAAGAGITAAVSRSGVILPALVAWYAWGEPMTPWRWLALGLVPIAMFMLRPREKKPRRLSLIDDAALAGCLLVAGIIFTIHKWAAVNLAPNQMELYKLTLFATAMATSLTYTLVRRCRFRRPELLVGGLLGLTNVASLVFVMGGLAAIPAVVFYPTSGSLTICLNVLVARWLWGEKLAGRQFGGLLLAVAVVLLTNA